MHNCHLGHWTYTNSINPDHFTQCPGVLIEQVEAIHRWVGERGSGNQVLTYSHDYLYWICSDCEWHYGQCWYCDTPWPVCECGDLGCNLGSHYKDCEAYRALPNMTEDVQES
jgi:hypothetical protein